MTNKEAKAIVKELHLERFIKNPTALAGEIDSVILAAVKRVFENMDCMDLELTIKLIDALQKTSIGLKKLEIDKQKAENEKIKLEMVRDYQKRINGNQQDPSYQQPILITKEDSNV
jgi:hypothetical protein